MNKEQITDALRAFLRQRPGLEWANYGSTASYRAESRSITRDLRHAMELLRAVELRSIPADAMLGKHGRLTVGPRIDWCTGQYWPVEYRAGVARYLASLLWDHWRDRCGCSTVEKIRAEASRSLSRVVVARFFR